MKRIVSSLLFTFMLILIIDSALMMNGLGWSNGGYSADPSNPDYGTHDWIAEHALDWLPTQEKRYILNNLAAYLYGTELPDSNKAPDGIGDSMAKHHIYYWSNGSLQDDAAAVRAFEEYNNALNFFRAKDYARAAKNVGIMSHYIVDMAVFGHVMGAGTEWGAEPQQIHSDYEDYVKNRTSSYDAEFSFYLSFDGVLSNVSAYDAAKNLAYDTTFDIDGDLTCVWMNQSYNWSNQTFKNRAGESLNLAVNYLTDVLHTLYLEAKPWGDWKHYHNYTEIVNTLLYLNDTYPDIIDVFSIGKSWQNLDIYCIRLTNENIDLLKPGVFFVGYHHAREPISSELPLYFAVNAATNYGTNATITYMLNYSEIYIVVALNVDAFDAVQANEWQRKNVHPFDEDGDSLFDEDPPDDEDGDGYTENLFFRNATYYEFLRWEGIDDDGDSLLNEDWIGGVDLNRNYGYQWNASAQSGSPYPRDEDYRGPAPFSEPETQAIRDFAMHQDFKYSVSFHSGAEDIVYPWGYATVPTPDDKIFRQVSGNLSALVGAPYGQAGNWYTLSGSLDDWIYANRSTFALTCEIYTNGSAWQYEPGPSPNTLWEKGVFQFFNPDPSNIETVVKRWLPVFTYISNRAITEADITPPTTVADYDGLWHKIDFTVTLAAIDDFAGVAETYYKINSGLTKNVSADGQPLITTEGANNKLEYWSVDNTGKEESPHKNLTGIRLDKAAPKIGIPSRVPGGDVSPEQEVKVLVNVTDTMSGVENVTLHYSLDNGTTWEEATPMNYNASTGLYEATILPQPLGTWVKYKVIAHDDAENQALNDNMGEYYVYIVVPEFQSAVTLSLFMVLTLLVVVFKSRNFFKKYRISFTNPFF